MMQKCRRKARPSHSLRLCNNLPSAAAPNFACVSLRCYRLFDFFLLRYRISLGSAILGCVLKRQEFNKNKSTERKRYGYVQILVSRSISNNPTSPRPPVFQKNERLRL